MGDVMEAGCEEEKINARKFVNKLHGMNVNKPKTSVWDKDIISNYAYSLKAIYLFEIILS